MKSMKHLSLLDNHFTSQESLPSVTKRVNLLEKYKSMSKVDAKYILQSCLPRNPSMIPSFVIADRQRYLEKKLERHRERMAAMSAEGT